MSTMTIGQAVAMGDVLREVSDERKRQHDKHGEQNIPDGELRLVPDLNYPDRIKAKNAERIASGNLTYFDLLVEEVAEAFDETDPALIRAELVQVAAVSVQWIEAIDRRQSQAKEEA